MQTTRILALLLALVAAVFSRGAATAATIFTDDFESGNLNNWTVTGSSPLTIATGTNIVPAGGNFSAVVDNSLDRMHRNIIADNGGSEISGHTVFSYWFYDDFGTASRVFNEIRAYSGGTGLPNGGSAASGTLSQLIAFGKYNSVTLPGEVFAGTKYQARAGFTTNVSIVWFNLDGPGSPNRSVGWHKFTMEREASGSTIHFYIDGILARTITDVVVDTFDTLILGFGAGSTVGNGWLDGVQLSSGVPTITADPQSATVAENGSVSFSVTDVGGLTYQWTHAGTNIPGANSRTLNLSGAHSGNAGDYAVIVGNSAGTTTSAIASLAVTERPNIVFASDNGPAGFSGALAGTADDGFVTLLQNAGYDVIRFNSDNSAAVLLTQPQIDALNTNDLIILGRSLGSGAFAAGQGTQWNTGITTPIIVQSSFLTRSGQLGWFVGSSAINNIPMPLTVVSPSDPENAFLFAGTTLNGATMTGNFDEAFGQNTSHTVDAPVAGATILATGFGTNNVIVEIPAGTAVKGGADILAGYRMYFASGNREPTPGGTVPQAGGEYLTSAGESIFIRAVQLAINGGVAPNLGEPVVITTQPAASTAACAGLPISLSVTATGQDPIAYQWYFSDGVTFTNAVDQGTRATLSFTSFDPTNAGFYAVVITNALGAVTSEVATVTLVGTGVVASALSSQTNCPGTPVTFTTTATGSGTLTYTWRKNGAVVQGPDGQNSYTIASVVAGDAGTYSVEVAGQCNSVTNSATLTVIALPAIAVQPQNLTAPMGNGVTFSVTGTGAGLSYQWLSNGVEIAGATASSLAVSGVTLANNGDAYRVEVSNCAGEVLSSAATLTVTPIAGVTFDFNSPRQFTNAPYYMVYNDWLSSSFNTPVTVFEDPIGGVGAFPGSGSLNLIPNNGTVNSAILLPLSYDFSLPGRTLKASVMVKIKNPINNNRNTQIGFLTTTNGDLDNAAGRVYASVLLQSTAQPAPTFELRTGNKPTAANSFQEGNAAAAGTLTVSNWYRITATFANNTDVLAGTYRITATLENMGPDGLAAPTTVATINNVTLTNVDLTPARNLYFVLRGTENTGVEGWDNVVVSAASGDIAFVQEPLSQTAEQGDRVTFRALVDGDGPYTYQWSKDGTPISGATSWKYVTPPVTTADNGAEYTVEVAGPNNTITSGGGTLTVTPKALAVVSAGSVDGATVGVKFNQPVDPASAETPANYTINGVAATHVRIHRSNFGPLGEDGIYVVVTPASVLSGAFTVTVSGVQDLSGGSIGAGNSASGNVAGLTGVDINPAVTGPAGEEYSFGPGEFHVTGGGADIWNAADQFHYVYSTQTGDFDVAAQIPFVDVVRAPTKAGFNVRASLDPFSPVVTAAVNPMWPGRDYPEGGIRHTWNVASVSWGANPTYNLAWYPNAWLRLRRAGNSFLRYSSTNGVDWQFDGQVTPNPALPETVYLGLAVCSVANGTPASALFQSYGPFAGYPGAAIAITSQPTNFTVNAGASFTDGVIATLTGGGAPASAGELTYVWQRGAGSGNWTNLPNAGLTNNTIAIGPLFASDNGAQFRVVVKAPGATDVISSTFTATVNDTAAPTVAGVNTVISPAYPVSEVVINFSELLGDSALDIGNFAVTNANGQVLTVLSAEFLNGDRRTIVVRVDGVLGTGTSRVGITGVQDLNGNTIANTTRTFRSFAPGVGPVVHEVYMDIGAGTTVADLTAHALYTGQIPTLTVYSNLFGFNVGINASTIPRLTYTLGTTAGDNYGVKSYTYFVPPTNGTYKFWIRADDQMQLLMNTNGTDPAGKTLIAALTAVSANYSVGTTPASSITNITLVGGQPYYMEVLMKEGGGSDGFSVMWTAPGVVAAPAATTFIPTANLAYPEAAARAPKAISEVYSAYPDFSPNRAVLAGIAEATNYPATLTSTRSANFNYVAGLPNGTQPNPGIGYHPYFGMQPTTANTRWDDYLGKLYSYFVAPSNGTYKFWLKVDDVAVFYMNTNEVNSTDPNGKIQLGQTANAFVSGAPYQLVGSNIRLNAGQRYYMETLWKEGGGGDGVSVVVRPQSDNATPAATTAPIPGDMLEFPADISRSGAVQFGGIAPATGTSLSAVEGENLILSVAGLLGAPPYGGFIWYKNGEKVLENSFTNVTPPIAASDDGAVYTVVVTNLFSSASRSITLSVTPDTTAPVINRIVGWRNRDGFTIQFNEAVDPLTASYLGSYAANNGLALLDATLDTSRRMLSVRTSLQAPGTTYGITVSGVRDASAAGNILNTNVAFSTWTVGGSGFLVEIFTNINGGAIIDLTGSPKFQANLPDNVYYTNVFGVGPFAANSGLDFYGARITGFFVPTNTGYYRFYMRSDDSSMLSMNINETNSDDPAGRTMLIHVPGANITMQSPVAMSVPVLLNQGQRYYTEALLKEGTGGDYLLLTFRNTDSSGTAVGNVPPQDTVAELQPAGINWDGVPGNPDAIQIVGIPPAEVTVNENDPVSLTITHTRPSNMLLSNFAYQWQRFDGSTFVDIPGANSATYEFFAALADDGQQIRLLFSAPGVSTSYTTLLHVNSDTVAPFMVSASSLDGNTIGVCFNEPVDPNTAGEPTNYYLNGDTQFSPISAVVRTNIDPRTVILTMGTPITGAFQLDATFISDFAANPNFGDSTVNARVQNLTPMDIGAPLGAGSSWTCTNGEIDVVAGGADIWGTADQGHFTIGQRTGDFDIWTQVQNLTRGTGDNDGITKAGIIVRETLDAGARKLHYFAEPPAAVGGRDIMEAGQRPTVNAATAAWSGGNGNTGVPAGIPNAWVRIKREGNLFTAYRSSDGVNWTPTTTHSMNLAKTVYVGLAATAHLPVAGANPTGTVNAEFRNVHVPNPPTITAHPSPENEIVAFGDPMSYTVTVDNPPDGGTVTYQWQRNGIAIAGATSDTYTIPSAGFADGGTYTVVVGNDGGEVTSQGATLTVSLPTLVADTAVVTNPNVPFNINAADLLTNDTEAVGLTVNAVSGIAPLTYSADFNAGLPAGAQIFGSATAEANGGANNSGYVRITAGVASLNGSLVLDELTPGRRVSAFRVDFKLRISDGSGEPADGFSFNFAPDLPIGVAAGRAAEDGQGNGFSFCVDNYRFLPFVGVGNPAGAGPSTTPNTSGMKINYRGIVVAGVQIPAAWNSPDWVPVTIVVSPVGELTVLVDGTNVFGAVTLPSWTPSAGRIGMYARTGGQFALHGVDDFSATVLTAETGSPSATADLFGSAYIDAGVLHLTDAVNGQAGSYIVNEITPGEAVTAFNASFKLRIGNGSADGADGFSFNFANDLPLAAAGAGAAEEGYGTGLSLTVDNYPGTGSADSPSLKLKYGGTLLGLVLIPKWNSPNFVPVTINLESDGTLDVTVDGTNVVSNFATPYVATAGRFGMYARTGGLNQQHWIDDLAINVTTATSSGSESRDFSQPHLATVTLNGGTITYTPQADGCGDDTFYYIISDPLFTGISAGEVTVQVVCGPTGPITIVQATRTATTFSASFNTEAGITYEVQYKNNIDDPQWTTLQVISGDGTLKTFTDNGPLPDTRFYQIVVQ